MGKVKVYAFPYAVGTANVYIDIKKLLKGNLEFIPFEYSGHGARICEELYTSIQEIVEDVFDKISDHLNTPYCLLGYSMGCRVCYELYYKLLNEGKRLPDYMFLFASDTPHAKREFKNYANLNDSELKIELQKLNGTPQEYLEDDELMEVVLPIARADLSAVDSYKPTTDQRKIACRAIVVRGSKEELLDSSTNEWEKYFDGKCECTFLNGGHFFLFENIRELADIINEKALTVKL